MSARTKGEVDYMPIERPQKGQLQLVSRTGETLHIDRFFDPIFFGLSCAREDDQLAQ